MRKITKFKTFDGKEFRTEELARRHLDHLYASQIMKLSHRMAASHAQLPEAIDSSIDDFLMLKRIKDDKEIEGDNRKQRANKSH